MSDYFVDLDGNITKKNKKKKKQSKYAVDLEGNITRTAIEEENSDIAPTKSDKNITSTVNSKSDYRNYAMTVSERKNRLDDKLLTNHTKEKSVSDYNTFDFYNLHKDIDSLSSDYEKRKTEKDNLETKIANMQMMVAPESEIEKEKKKLKNYSDLDEQKKELDTKKNKYEYGTKQQTLKHLSGVVNNKDFKKYVEKGVIDYNSDFEDWYDQMTDKERKIYRYYIGKGDKKSAEKYRDALQETLNYRKAQDKFEDIEGNTALEILYGGKLGLQQFGQGMKNLGNMIIGNDEDVSKVATSEQILSGMISEDLADNSIPMWYNFKEGKWEDKILNRSTAQLGFDTLNTGANMVPSILASLGVSAVATPAAGAAVGATLMGGSAAGNAYQNGLAEGMEEDEARAYGITIGALEGSLQYALGGIGKLGGTSAKISKAVSGIDKAALRLSLQYGGQVSSEALEEGMQEVLDPLVKNMVDSDADESVDWEEVAYSALMGAFMGGTMGGNVNTNTNTNKFTENEQKVIDKEIANRIEEAEKDGKTISKKEKSKIQDDVLRDLERGYISTDTIESVLGNETYNTYKSMEEQENSLREEIEALENTPENQFTVKQRERLTELREQLNNLDKTSVKEKLSSEVFELAKVDRLSESYNEKARKSQAFEADLTKYDAKQQEVIQKAIDSKILNNTNRTHEFVDMVAKISADKGVLFDFTNNQKLKESGFAVEGKTVNGYVKDGNIAVNIDSNKSLNSVVGHEITHILEGTELYSELQNVVREYATTKGEYGTRVKEFFEIYKDVEGADLNSEITADLIGDYLFTDADFVNNLSKKNPNIFKKIYNEIKYLYKVATAGSKEARQLEKVKRAFEKAYKQSSRVNNDIKYSLEKTGDGTEYVKSEKGKYIKEDGTLVEEKEIFNSLINRVFNLSDGEVKIVNRLPDKSMYAELFKRRPNYKNVDDIKQLNSDINYNMEELIDNSKLKSPNIPDIDGKHSKQGIKSFDTRTVDFYDGSKAYTVDFSIAELNNGEKIVYAKKKAKYNEELTKKIQTSEAMGEKSQLNQKPVFDDKLSQKQSDVKEKISLTEDNKGRKLTKEQQNFLKDSKVVDADGNIKTMYHGSSEEFNVFDIKKAKSSGHYGRGFYFSDSESHAGQYGSTYEVYLNITNPVQAGTRNITKEQLRKFVEVVAENEDYGIENYGYGATVDSVTDSVYGKDDFGILVDINTTAIGDMVEAVKLFNEVNGTNYDGIIAETETVAFYPNQIKRVDNVAPTSSDDIRYSLSDANKDIAPVGNYNVYGKDIALQQDIAPVKETISEKNTVSDNYAPLTEAEKTSENATTNSQSIKNDTVYEQLQKNLDKLNQMEVVGSINTVYGMEKWTKKDIVEWTMKQLESTDYKIIREGIGRILFGKKQIKQSMAYMSMEDMETYVHTLMPEVLKKGIEIESRENHKGREYATKTFAAPVEVNGKRGNMAVVVKKTTDNFYKVHRLVTPDGKVFEFEHKNKTALPNDGGVADNSSLATSTNAASNSIISSISENTTEKSDKNSKQDLVEEDIAPLPQNIESETVPRESNKNERRWVGTSTESEVVDKKILPEDLDPKAISYQPIPNKRTLNNANSMLERYGYEDSVVYFNSQFMNKNTSLDDIALGERLVQEAIKKGDMKTAGELIQNISILGTELGQKVQALSIIQRLTPEGQLKMLTKVVERGKTKGDKAFEGVEITQEMIDHILNTYGKDGTYNQKKLDKAVEDVKKQIADQMKVTKMDKVNAWRYLSMLGNPKTHIRNLISNVAMQGTMAAKNAVARTIESIAPIENKTQTWKRASDDVKAFAKQTTKEMKDVISGDNKYSEASGIKEQRKIFKNKILNGVYEFNSNLLEKEDWWFSSFAFEKTLSKYLTANGIKTKEDIKNNPEIIEKAKIYATEQAQIATFRQYSYMANKIGEYERKNTATQLAVGAVVPFKKTPVNIAKTGLNYSPLGFMKTLTYDISQVRKGNMEASTLVDHLAQNITGTGLALAGYMLAQAGFLNGGSEDDEEAKYDYQLGKQSYSLNIGGNTYSLSWLTPVAMPLFVGANFYDQLVEDKEWNPDVAIESLTQTLDPMSEMSVLSGLTSILSSYESGTGIWADIGGTMAQNYITQFVPTLSSQIATVMDDTKRTTKVAGNSKAKLIDETINQLKLKIPILRQTLEPSTDIWGNEVKQNENMLGRVFETFIAPYSKKESIATEIDEELKELHSKTGESGLFPNVPRNYVKYENEKYNMSASEHTDFKKKYGQTALELMEEMFNSSTYKNADSKEKAEMIDKVYDYASDEAKLDYLSKKDVEYTNATKDGEKYYKEADIKGAVAKDMPLDEYKFYKENPERYEFFKKNNISYNDYANGDEETKYAYTWAYNNPEKFIVSKAIADDVVTYKTYTKALDKIKADTDANGKTINGSKKEKVLDYINSLDADYGAKLILFKSEYNSDDTYNYEIIDYLNSREDITYDEMNTILTELGFKVDSKGNISWD